MPSQKEKKEEFNIPINIFGKKNNEEAQEKNEKEIIPVMISEKKREFFNYEKMDSKDRVNEKTNEKKIAWVKRKNEAEKRKIMWAVVACFMVVIISVWAIFLKYNILLENLSIKQLQRDEEWAKIKDDFDKSYQNFENVVEEYNKEADTKDGTARTEAETGATTEMETGLEKNKIDISIEDIEKLKEKIIESN
ncbi:MAG: hypothetical protein V1655_00680 [bacterium]